ncbi:MAG TPA: hypothetical protein VF337_09205 [Candidatus Limnocylindrales bacterium]
MSRVSAFAASHPDSKAYGRLVAVGIALSLVAVGCGSSAVPSRSPSPIASVAAGEVGAPLPVGLSSNLDKLDSYQFSQSIPRPSAAPSSGPAPTNQDPLTITGTVVNRPVKALSIDTHPSQFIVVGDQAWQSTDGITWTAGDPTDTILAGLLPGHDYPTWFDAKASYFHAVGEESKNGVPCIHYRGDASLEGLFSGSVGTSVSFLAELWVAQDGLYPVSGTFGFSASAEAPGMSWGFHFEILKANDAANLVSAPSNVVALPS